jgi:hypothetical protein
MTTSTQTTLGPPRLPIILLRLLLIAGLVVLFVVLSAPLRQINPLQLRIATNILFFVALGMADEWLLAPVLNRWPLARTAAIVVETLALGWFFSPGAVNPAPKFLFFTHIAPFFVAVLGGALLVAIVRRVRRV